MNCTNSFGLLESLGLPPPNELDGCLSPRNSFKNGRESVGGKVHRSTGRRCDPQRQRNPNPCLNGNSKLCPTEPRYENPCNQFPSTIPPRFQQKPGRCNPAPRPCSEIIDPCLTSTSPCSTTMHLNQQLKEQVFLALQKQPHVTCPDKPMPMPHVRQACDSPAQPICIPTPPSRPDPSKAEQDNILPSTTTPRPADLQLSQVPEVVSNTTDATPPIDPSDKVIVSFPPPGLRKPVRGRGRGRGSTKPAHGDRRPPPAAEDSNFERFNGPAAASPVSSPPPPGLTSSVVKLPARQDAPRSPSTASSSLSEDLSGSSSVLSSDTTCTSVDSHPSDKASQPLRLSNEICRNWSRGFRCFTFPCRFRHPGRPNERDNPAKQPTQVSLTPIKTSAHVRDPVNGFIPRNQDPPSGNAEPPPRSEPLYATTISDHIKVRFDHGFEVRDVVTGFESRWVHLGNIAGSVTSAALNGLLGPYKPDVINLPESSSAKPVTAKVQFASPADAIKAVTDLNGIEFAGRTITAKSAINNSVNGSTMLRDTDVQLVWECPSRVGYAGYDTLKEATAAIDCINGFPSEYLVVSAQLYEGLPCIGAYNVIFKQIPASMNEKGLREFANSKSVMLERPNYQSLDKAVDFIRSRLEEYGTMTSFDVIAPPFRDGLVKAWAHFTFPAEARAAQDDLDRRRPKAMGHTTLSCRHVVSVTHTLSAASYRRMREDIGWLRESWYHRYGPGISIREKNKENVDNDAPAHIRISSDRSELLSHLKYEFEQLLHGYPILLEKKPLWDDFLVVEAGRTFIAQVQAQCPGVEIQIQKYRRVVSLWGPITMRHQARQEIVRKLSELKAQQFWKIPLSGRLLGIFCSAELSTLQDLLGPDNCILDFEERVLVVRGNDVAFRIACSAVQAAQAAQNRQDGETRTSDAICPVCFGEAIVPVSLGCGHQWCRACLTGYLMSAVENKMFPLRCLGNDAMCTECIPLGLSRKVLSAAEFNAVLEAAFWVYVHSRSDEFHHCPTPDCTQVYRSAPRNAVLQCPSCLVRICPACRIEYHDGLTCEERDVADDKLFKEWTASHNVKSCPGCKAPIERSEGCNHVTCTRCQTHICWECLATFPKGQGIYDHMRMQHGSIGL